MTNEQSSGDLRAAWQGHAPGPIKMLPEDLRRKAREMHNRILWRNIREYAASVPVVAIFGYYLWKFQTPLLRLGSGLVIVAALFVAWRLHRKGSARAALSAGATPGATPLDAAFQSCLDFHRRQLERQRDLLASVWAWYLLPFVPGLVVFLLGVALAQTADRHGQAGHAAIAFGVSMAASSIVFFAIWKLNQSGANKLQQQIDALAGLERDS